MFVVFQTLVLNFRTVMSHHIYLKKELVWEPHL